MSNGMLWQRREVILLFVDNLLFHLPVARRKGVEMVDRGSFVRVFGLRFGACRMHLSIVASRVPFHCNSGLRGGCVGLLGVKCLRLRRLQCSFWLFRLLCRLWLTAKER